MDYIDKDYLINKFTTMLTENPVKLDLQEIIKVINECVEEEVIVCGRDYWLDCYDIFTQTWHTDDNSFTRDSFIIYRKNDSNIE